MSLQKEGPMFDETPSGLVSFPPFEAMTQHPPTKHLDILHAAKANVVVSRIHAWRDGTINQRPHSAAW